jgi:hypothetical protein
MHYRALSIGDYLQATEFNGRVPTFTITQIVIKDLPSLKNEGEEQSKGVIYFRELKRGWVINRTNGESMNAMFGKETNDWIGKRVTLRAEDVQVGKKMDMGIRVVGSPDIKAPVTFDLCLPRKKPKKVRLVPTVPGQPVVFEEPPADAPAALPEREAGQEG